MNFSQDNRGFTIVEVIIAAFVFSVIVLGVASVFVRATSLQRRAFAAEQIQSTTLAAVEIISRDVRVSDICPNSSVCSSSVLEMNHPVRGLIRYTFSSSTGKVRRTEGGATGDLTSSDVYYSVFNFTTVNGASDCRQPRVTLNIQAQNRKGIPFTVSMQTSIVSRDIRKELLSPPAICP